MARLHYLRNPLSPSDRDTHNLKPGTAVIDWLQEHYANGCDGSVRFFVNGFERPLDDLDYVPADEDEIVLAVNPTGLDPITVSLIISVVMMAAKMALNALMASPTGKAPEPPPFARVDNAQPSTVYSVRSNQNQARLGEAVPVPYGEVLHTPDWVSQPYAFYENGKDQYLDILLCLGLGEFNVKQVLIGDSDVQEITDNSVQYHLIPPSQHQMQMGNLGVPWTPAFQENTISAEEVGTQEFLNAGDKAGFFRLGKTGQVGRLISVDISFPRGLYQMPSWGTPLPSNAQWFLNVVQADEDGVAIPGTEQEFSTNYYTPTGSLDPVRLTYTYDTGIDASWLCQLERRMVAQPNGGETNQYQWVGLKMQVKNTTEPVYGDVTLMAVRLKATQVSSGVEQLVKVRLERKLPLLGSGPPVTTASPADAFIDMYCNTIYGARRPLAEVDVPYFTLLKNYWGPNYRFDAVYTGKTTVWEALTQALKGVAAAPLPTGSIMTAMQDGPKAFRQIIFTEQNIAADTFKLVYSFDELGAPDGVEIEYRTPANFAPAYVRYPTTAVDPEKIVLFGCTNKTHASQYARLMWQRKMFNRRAVTFDTEKEGMIPLPGARAGVGHTLPRWGMNGFVVGVEDDRVNITLDRALKWSESPGPYYMVFRDEYGGASAMVEVIRGAADDKAVLLADPWATGNGDWSLTLRQEITQFTWGDGERVIKDFILTELSPQGGAAVGVTGIFYDPLVYVDTLDFLANPVP